MKERVSFQIKERGILKTESKTFDSIEQACNYVKTIKGHMSIVGRPTIETVYNKEMKFVGR